MIFKPNGEQALVAYDKNGDEISTAYNKAGAVVFQNRYATFTDTALSFSAHGNQGFDYYNGIIVQYSGSSYNLELIRLSDGTTLRYIPSGLTVHGNDVSFLPFKYAETDEFPLLYIGGYVLRINRAAGTASTVFGISTPHGDGKTGWANYGSAFVGNTLYTIGYSTTYTDTNSLVFIETWDLSESIEAPRLVSQVTRPWVVCIQGAAYHDGLLWAACGIGVQATGAHIYAFDTEDASIVHDLRLNHYNELEGIAWTSENDNDGDILYGTYGGKYHKITF